MTATIGERLDCVDTGRGFPVGATVIVYTSHRSNHDEFFLSDHMPRDEYGNLHHVVGRGRVVEATGGKRATVEITETRADVLEWWKTQNENPES